MFTDLSKSPVTEIHARMYLQSLSWKNARTSSGDVLSVQRAASGFSRH